MSNKVVNTTQLDADLTRIAEAIREKGGTSAALLFPDEFITVINELDSGYPVTVRHCGANAIVTAYKGTSQETATANADGVAVFPKLASGIWTFTSNVFTSQRTVQIKGATTTSILPSEYKEIEYLESTGTQYIDTDIKQTGNAGFKIDCMMPAEIVQSALIGSHINGGVGGGTIRQKSDGKPYFQYGTTSTISEYALTNNIFSTRHVYEFNSSTHKNAFFIDGVSKISSAAAGNTGLSFYLFAAHTSGTGATNPNGIAGVKRIFYCEMFTSQVLTRAFVPCVDNNGVGGMYDLVEGKFYTNSGTGDFNVGEAVEQNANGMIIYSAPVGLTVTAIKGGENLPVSKTTICDKELHCFIVKPQYFGEITVTAGDKVQTVIVDSNITVMLQHAVFLFKDGNQYADVTGGWSRASSSTSSGSTVTIGNTIEVKSLATQGAVIAITGNKIEFANYTKAKIALSSIVKGSQNPSIAFEIHNTIAYSDVSASQAVTAVGEYDIPLSTLTNGFIGLKVYCATVLVDAVWLE